VALGDRIGARGIEGPGVASTYRLELIARFVQVFRPRRAQRCRRVVGPLEHREPLPLLDRIADHDLHSLEDAVGLGEDLVLHLHRLEHHEWLAGGYRSVALMPDGDDGAGERRQDGHLFRHRC